MEGVWCSKKDHFQFQVLSLGNVLGVNFARYRELDQDFKALFSIWNFFATQLKNMISSNRMVRRSFKISPKKMLET